MDAGDGDAPSAPEGADEWWETKGQPRHTNKGISRTLDVSNREHPWVGW